MGGAVGVGVWDGVGVADADADGVLDGVAEGVGAAVDVTGGLALGVGLAGVAGISDGRSNCCTGWPSRAAFMYAVQIRAGNDPPVTVDRPPVPESEIGSPLGPSLTIMTAVTN